MRPSQQTTTIARRLSLSSSDAGISARENISTAGMKTPSVLYLHD
jgi:hypothetical protein